MTWVIHPATPRTSPELHVYNPKLVSQESPTSQIRDLAERGLDISSDDLVNIGPLVDCSRADLVGSVMAYLRHSGRWEDAAWDLGIHRKTPRHRIGAASREWGRALTIRTWPAGYGWRCVQLALPDVGPGRCTGEASF